TFKGLVIGSFTNHSLQASNLSAGLAARGLTSSATVNQAWDIDPAVGGPLVKDKLWFWGSVRAQKTEQTLAGIFFNLTPTGHAYTPDLSRPALSSAENENVSVRLTWQVRPKKKIHPQHEKPGPP